MSPLTRWVTSGICCCRQFVMTCISCRRTASWSYQGAPQPRISLHYLPSRPWGISSSVHGKEGCNPSSHDFDVQWSIWCLNEVQAVWLEIIQGDLWRCLWVCHAHGQVFFQCTYIGIATLCQLRLRLFLSLPQGTRNRVMCTLLSFRSCSVPIV